MNKEGNELCIIYTWIYGCFHGLESVFVTCTVHVTKQHLVIIIFLKKTSAAHYSGTIGIAVLELK